MWMPSRCFRESTRVSVARGAPPETYKSPAGGRPDLARRGLSQSAARTADDTAIAPVAKQESAQRDRGRPPTQEKEQVPRAVRPIFCPLSNSMDPTLT